MVGMWSSSATVMNSKLTHAYPLNLPSPVSWEIHKVQGKLKIRRIKGIQSGPPFLFFIFFQIFKPRA